MGNDDPEVMKNGLRHRNVEAVAPPEEDPEPTTALGILKKWPKSTFCIIGNEFCERFSYYGMRAVLMLYFINVLKFSKKSSIILFHGFTVFAYTSPLFGSILADGYIGKFRTIFCLSVVYAIGQITLAVASIFHLESGIHPWLDIIGLFVIAFGTGGIKPCVAAFGGDQFKPHHVKMISMFFSMFYFMINAGSTVSTWVTPLFRVHPCLGQDNCYPLAFGVPAVLMIVATVLFVAGGFAYIKKPPQENVLLRVVSVVKTALKNKWNSRTEARNHWLEHYLDTHDCKMDTKCVDLQESMGDVTVCAQTKFISDIRSLIRVIIMMSPVPFFWALYDQQSSVWTIQAVSMDTRVTKNFNLLPDQMSSVNAVLIMLFIPLFQFIIYPICAKFVKLTDLRKMAVGGLLSATAFIVAGFVQLSVNQTLPAAPSNGHVLVSFVNSYSTSCNVTFSIGETSRTMGPNSALVDDKVTGRNELLSLPIGNYSVTMNFRGDCLGVQPLNQILRVQFSQSTVYYVAATPEGVFYSDTDTKKPTNGRGESNLRLTLLTPCSQIQNETVRSWGCSTGNESLNTYYGRIAICGYNPQAIDHPCDPRDKSNYHYYVWKTPESDFHRQPYQQFNGVSFVAANGTAFGFNDVNEGRYRAYYVNYPHGDSDRTPAKDEIEVYPIPDIDFEVHDVGGVYVLTASQDGRNSPQNVFNIWTVVPPNSCSILLQIPQYVILTASEILFSITGLEFCYSQAAPSMKSVVQAIWLLTVAGGDLIIILITEADMFSNVAVSLFTYAGVMIVLTIVFILLSIFYYDYVDYTSTTSPEPKTSSATSGRSKIYDNISRISEKQL